ncbi:hypothetical protein M422DRAFT_247111 [Sphaerobolus stellatus SS14]|nr:hypothetical protein M422DRAFT_247111 [Sphaerobolus stellatus SS14]
MNDFPYTVEGKAAFMCQKDEEETPLGYDKDRCDHCQNKGPKLKSGAQRIAHMSVHILHDATLQGKENILPFACVSMLLVNFTSSHTKAKLHNWILLCQYALA